MAIIRTSTLKITLISLGALLLGNVMDTNNFGQFVIGLILTSLFVYSFTLGRNNVFSFIMVLFFCSLFPYKVSGGGAFNMVALMCALFYLLIKQRIPGEYNSQSNLFKGFVFIFIISCLLGWMVNYTGTLQELSISIVSFGGVIFLLLVSSRIVLNEERVILFLKLNLVLIIYSTIASINKYIKIITIETPMMPVYGNEKIIEGNIESGGIIGVSPMYGQHSMLVAMLFATFLITGLYYSNRHFGKKYIFAGLLLAVLNIFLSISKAVFYSTIAGILLIYLLQYRVIKIDGLKKLREFIVILTIGLGILFIVKQVGLDYVFYRIEETQGRVKQTSGSTFEKILNGTALNRGDAFEEASKKYNSKDNWLIGYGWSTTANNRNAYYVDPEINRGSAHSQYFAILFMFGWPGFIAFFGLHIIGIRKSFKLTSIHSIGNTKRRYALFSIIMLTVLLLHGFTADNINWPTYFGATIILLGMTFANIESVKYLNNYKQVYRKVLK